MTNTGSEGARWYRDTVGWLLLVVLAGVWWSAASPGLSAVRERVVDECCYIDWALKNQPIPRDWMGLKLVPVWLIREVLNSPPGMPGALGWARWVFSGWSIALLVATYFWRLTEGESPRTCTFLALVMGTMPGVLYGWGRLLSENAALAFLVLGIAATRGATVAGNPTRRWGSSGMAVVAFTGAYCCRSTIISSIGAYLVWELVREYSGGAAGSLWRRVWGLRALAVGLGTGLVLGGMILLLPLPVSPFGQATGHISGWQVSPKANLVAFLAPGGLWLPLALAGTMWVLALCTGKPLKDLIIGWTWVFLAAFPYFYLWARGAWVLPRHAVDLVVPLVHVLALVARGLEARPQPGPGRRILLGGILVLATLAWGLAHSLMAGWVGWYSHQSRVAGPFWKWLLPAVLLGVLLEVARRSPRRWVRAGLVGLALAAMLLSHVRAPLRAMGIDQTFVDIEGIRSMVLANAVSRTEVLRVVGVDYEIATIRRAMPDFRVDRLNGGGDWGRPDALRGPATWLLASRRASFDFPDQVERALAPDGPSRQAEVKDFSGDWTLYLIRSPRGVAGGRAGS